MIALDIAGSRGDLLILTRGLVGSPHRVPKVASATWDTAGKTILCVRGGPKQWVLQERDFGPGVPKQSLTFRADRIGRTTQLDDGSICVLAWKDEKGLLIRWSYPKKTIQQFRFPPGVLPHPDWTIPRTRSAGHAVIASQDASVLLGFHLETQRWAYAKGNGRRGWAWTSLLDPHDLQDAAYGWQSPIRRPNLFLSDPGGNGGVLFWNPLLPVSVEGGRSLLPNNLLAPLDLPQAQYGPRRFSQFARNPGRHNWVVPAGIPSGISFANDQELALLSYGEPITEQNGDRLRVSKYALVGPERSPELLIPRSLQSDAAPSVALLPNGDGLLLLSRAKGGLELAELDLNGETRAVSKLSE